MIRTAARSTRSGSAAPRCSNTRRSPGGSASPSAPGVTRPTFPSVTVAPDLTGDLVLVMPTDEPPAPDLVTDLLLARRYSGADLVSAGGTVLVDRSLVRRVGTDPAQLLDGGPRGRGHRLPHARIA